MITDPRCDKCEFWERKAENWQAGTAGFRECTAVRPRWHIEDDITTTEYKADPDGWIAAIVAARAYVQDGSEYVAILYTGPDFYCALYSELKPATGV